MAVRKTTIAIDEELLAEAREYLGTTSIRETVDGALRAIRRRAAFERLVEHAKTEDVQRMADKAFRERAWRGEDPWSNP